MTKFPSPITHAPNNTTTFQLQKSLPTMTNNHHGKNQHQRHPTTSTNTPAIEISIGSAQVFDLCTVLRQWRDRGDRIILLMEANNKVFDGLMSKELAADDIKLQEAVHSVKPGPGPKTYIRGKDSIDGI